MFFVEHVLHRVLQFLKRLRVRLIVFLLGGARAGKKQHQRCDEQCCGGGQINAAHAALLWANVPTEGRILSVNPHDAKEIAEKASFGAASQTIDAARTLAYDAARYSFAF